MIFTKTFLLNGTIMKKLRFCLAVKYKFFYKNIKNLKM